MSEGDFIYQLAKSETEKELPEWLQSEAVGSKIEIVSSTRLPLAFSSEERHLISRRAKLTNIPDGTYVWMGEGWVDQESQKRTKTGMRVAILRIKYPYGKLRYYFIPLKKFVG